MHLPNIEIQFHNHELRFFHVFIWNKIPHHLGKKLKQQKVENPFFCCRQSQYVAQTHHNI